MFAKVFSRTVSLLYGRYRFSALLSVLLALLIGPELFLDEGVSTTWYDLLVSAAVFVAIFSLCSVKRARIFALIFGPPSILLSITSKMVAPQLAERMLFAGYVSQGLFFFGTSLLVVRSMFSREQLDADSIAGAAAGYIFLGLGWGVLFTIVESLQPGSFDFSQAFVLQQSGEASQRELLTYLSFVTLTTVGYGDITPVTKTACSLTWLEAMSGQFYLAVVVAAVVSLLVTGNRPTTT